MTTVHVNSHDASISESFLRRSRWLPLAILPVATAILGAHWQPWLLMWGIALAIYGGLKWLSFADGRQARIAPLSLALGYLLLWPGMDAATFFGRRHALQTRTGEWVAAVGKFAVGLWLILFIAPRLAVHGQLAAGWIVMLGIVLTLHFGLFHLLALGWQGRGVAARTIMYEPLRAASLSDFWGRRWNLGFRDLAHAYVFRPLLPTFGAAAATLAVFAVSGAVHDVVISGPARAGWGLPTLYFLLQGGGVLLQHSRAGRRLGLGRGAVGRLFLALVAIAPLPLLFHRPFVERIVLPMLANITAR